MFGVAGTSVATATVADGSFSLTFEPVSADTKTVCFESIRATNGKSQEYA